MEQTPLKLQLNPAFHPQEIPSEDPSTYITVTCRLKPLLPQEQKSIIEVDKTLHQITLNDPTKSISKTYTFDRVFDQTICQDKFANNICNPLVKFLKNGGESGLIFSYGITNSGKTYTILGTNEQPGILLTLIRKLQQEFPEETLKIVACELYKDEFMSLKNKGQKVHPKEIKGTISFDDCDSDEINERNMGALFQNYLQNRSCAPTAYNSVSSRSHAIFKVTGKNFKIGIVDLAGSERTSKQNNETPTDMKETIFINRSLLTLKKCIRALEDRSILTQKIVVPYRESKLTQALMEYFVNNSRINIIVNVNQARHCLEQNLNAMDYTSKAKNIKANATNDFSKMMKILTSKKKIEVSMFKPKIFVSNTQQLKRYSEKVLSQKKYIIDEEKVEAEEIELSFEKEIQKQERRSEMMKCQTQQMLDQIMEGPNIIEDFIEKQRLFREVYLATDLAIQIEMDQRKFSALRKVNLIETTQKKQKPSPSQFKLKNQVQTFELGTQILPGQLRSDSDQLEERLGKMEYEKLRTSVKNKLMRVLNQEQKKKLIDAETMWSDRKSQSVQNVESRKIEEKSVQEEEQSNYTTPHKNSTKQVKIIRKTKTIIKHSENKGILKSLAKGAQSTLNGIKSCVKSGAKFITGFGKSSFKSKPQSKVSPPKRKINLQSQRLFEILINPSSKIIYEAEVQTEVEILKSNKKVSILDQEPQMNSDGEVQIDLPPVMVEKEIVIETFEVGIQTEKIQIKYLTQDFIDQNMEDQKNLYEMEKKERKHKGLSTYSEESTVIEQSENNEIESPEKPKQKEKAGKQIKFQDPKTAFKSFSINRKDVKVSLKKQKALITNTKSAIAKHTRGAQKKAKKGQMKK